MSGCRDNQKVKYIAGSFVGKALTWWNSQIHTRSREADVGMSWEDFKTLTREEFCPSNEMLVPHLVTPENKRTERYIYGWLPQNIRGDGGGIGLKSIRADNSKGDDKELVVIREVGEFLLGRGEGGEGGTS
ncbi:hypothetical protein Tco_0845460 [Tanacetum coccineum]